MVKPCMKEVIIEMMGEEENTLIPKNLPEISL